MTEETRLSALIDDYLRFVWGRDPIEATQAGIHDLDAGLTDLSPAAFAEEIVQRKQYLARFEAMDRNALDADAGMDLDVARIDARSALRRLTERPVWTSAPYWVVEQLGAGCSALMRDDGTDVAAQGEALWARLRQAPRRTWTRPPPRGCTWAWG
jgi:uncharacterized protein (DUF885 family)